MRSWNASALEDHIRQGHEWKARAEALAAALQWIANFANDPGHMSTAKTLHYDMAGRAHAALARLPAQALAERRALEACAEYVRDHHACPDAEECIGCAVLAALDAARKEG